jgi:hypothetical protein
MFAADFTQDIPVYVTSYRKFTYGKGVKMVSQHVCNGGMVWL